MITYTSEVVGAGHPDKVADCISDAVLDACLGQDPESRVALETTVKAGSRDPKWFTLNDEVYFDRQGVNRDVAGTVNLIGEITTRAGFYIEALVRRTIRGIGYHDAKMGIDPEGCIIRTHITTQSSDIAQGVDIGESHDQGAGDQGMMYGFACDETGELMPLSLVTARALIDRLDFVRTEGTLAFLRPDCKSQVTIEFREDGSCYLRNLTIAAQHNSTVSNRDLEDAVRHYVINPVIESSGLDGIDPNGRITINGTGRFEIGGPLGDAGVTGRKIIVDTYGGRIPHGGGAFSGKDPSKVDRSAHYMMRHIAKSVVANVLADECQVRVAYTIGIAEPDDFEVRVGPTNRINEKLSRKLREHFDLRPAAIIEYLGLKRPIYLETARRGHFGIRPTEDGAYSWEKVADLS